VNARLLSCLLPRHAHVRVRSNSPHAQASSPRLRMHAVLFKR
jgi:hypothetical protein